MSEASQQDSNDSDHLSGSNYQCLQWPSFTPPLAGSLMCHSLYFQVQEHKNWVRQAPHWLCCLLRHQRGTHCGRAPAGTPPALERAAWQQRSAACSCQTATVPLQARQTCHPCRRLWPPQPPAPPWSQTCICAPWNFISWSTNYHAPFDLVDLPTDSDSRACMQTRCSTRTWRGIS